MNTQNKKSNKLQIAEYKEYIDNLVKENKALKETIEQMRHMSDFALFCYYVDKGFKSLQLDKTMIYELQVNAYPHIKEQYLQYMIKRQMQCLN